MAERYNGPGSPYWSLKTFAILMLSDEHTFWAAKAAPMPELETQKVLKYADMLIHIYKNHNTAYTSGKYSPSGHGQSQAKYGKFAYDTRFGFNVSKSCYELHEAAPDSMLAFIVNGYVYVRRICENFTIEENKVMSKWSPYQGIIVETTIIPTDEGHIRQHSIYSEIDCDAYDCGFAVAADPEQGIWTSADLGKAIAECNFESCEVIGNIKDNSSADLDNGEIIVADPNTNLLYPKTVIPAVKYKIHKGKNVVETIIIAIWKK